MYSGNLGRALEVPTLVEGARLLLRRHGDTTRVQFVGDGELAGRVDAAMLESPAISREPPRPLERLSESLSAADIHLVGQGRGHLLAQVLDELGELVDPDRRVAEVVEVGQGGPGEPRLEVAPGRAVVRGQEKADQEPNL